MCFCPSVKEAPVSLTVVSCGPAAPVANAYVSVSEDVYATVITYVCKPGYKLLPGGALTRKCQADKRWSGTAPQCEGTHLLHATESICNSSRGYICGWIIGCGK